MYFLFYAVGWATLAILVGEYAKRRERDARNWSAIAFLISPPVAFSILLAIERASRSHNSLYEGSDQAEVTGDNAATNS